MVYILIAKQMTPIVNQITLLNQDGLIYFNDVY